MGFSLQRHVAERAKEHYDLRIGDPDTGHAHSWALRYIPKPGERRLAVQQPTHTVPYMDFAGSIESGYGKGDVVLERREPTEILHADDKTVRFNLYKGKGVESLALRRTKGNQWLLQNVTPTRSEGPGKVLPASKPSYRVAKPEKLNLEDESTELQAKIDGAHVLYHLKGPGTGVKIHSYRPTERDTGVIEHTPRVPGFSKMTVPKGMGDTVLRGELYATDDKGKALPAARVGGILNANVWKSREKQEQEGKLVPVVFDVARWKGKDVEGAPYSEKKRMLDEAAKELPWLKRPRTATTPEDKRRLLADIKEGKEPSTEEGVIEWHKDKPVPTKAKLLQERDVYVRRVFPEKGSRGMAGGFEFSYTKGGPVVGRVGTGIAHRMKREMQQSPEQYKGLKARILMQRAPEHYAPRAPVFHSFHLDQELPEEKTSSRMVTTADGESISTKELAARYADRLRAAAKATKAAKVMTKIELLEKLAKDYGNNSKGYKLQGRTEFQGLPIAIENRKGSVRRGKNEDGSSWQTRFKRPYGYIEGTKGADGEEVDVYLGTKKDAPKAYVVHQRKDDGSYDEDTVMLGFGSKGEAVRTIKQHYDDPRYIGKTDILEMSALKRKLKGGRVLTKEGLLHKLADGAAKKKVVFQGLTVHIDRPRGFVMRGKDKAGKKWERTYTTDYGFIPGASGGDGDSLDVFVGPSKASRRTFWARQVKPDGRFDEYKVFVGYDSKDEAIRVYKEHIPAKLLAGMFEVSIDILKALLGGKPKGEVTRASTF